MSIRQTDIKDSNVIKTLSGFGNCFFSRGSHRHVIPFSPQDTLDDVKKIKLIIDDQYAVSLIHLVIPHFMVAPQAD